MQGRMLRFVIMLSVVSASLWAHTSAALPSHGGSFLSMLGGFDRAALQRGFQVYREVCSVCHSVKRVAFRHLKAMGWTDAEVKALAAQYTIKDISTDTGEPIERPGRISDFLPAPYANDIVARSANNGALPVDLSLITKARKGGADYVFGLLMGFKEAPADVKLEPGQYYNEYFPGHVLSMTPPLMHDGQVTYADGTVATVEQMARDVTTFLAWASEPEMEERKQSGVKVLMYLLAMTVVFYICKRRIWSRIKY